jgi:hypothetical protein
VAQAETGSRKFSLEDLLLVALAYETTPAELLVGTDNDWVELSPEARLTVRTLRALLTGTNVSIHSPGPHVDVPATRTPGAPDQAVVTEARQFGVRRHADVDRAVSGIGDPERHAARKLGTTPERLSLAALARWGRTLVEERDYRLKQRLKDEDASGCGAQALRGHITRELVAELEVDLRQRGIL